MAGSRGVDVRRKQQHEQRHQPVRRPAIDPGHHESDRAREFREAGDGHEGAGIWQLRRHHRDEIRARAGEVRDGGEDEHQRQTGARRRLPVVERRPPQHADPAGQRDAGDHHVERNHTGNLNSELRTQN